MNIDYINIFEFSVSQPEFSTRINLDKKNFLVNQIFSFELSEKNFVDLKDIIRNTSSSKVTIYIGEIDITDSSFKLDKTCINDDVEIRIEHNLTNIDYPLFICNENDLYDFLKTCIIPLEIKDINRINNTLLVNVVGEEPSKKIQLRTDLCAFLHDNGYSNKKASVIPNVLPREYWQRFSKNILEAFFTCISERVLSRNEFLIKIGNVAPEIIPEDVNLTTEEIDYIYSIVKFIFGDANRYEDKLQILRKVMTNFSNKKNIMEFSWKNIFQVVKDNYSLFIDKKIDTFFVTEQKLYEQFRIIFEDISKDINSKIDEVSKQVLTILATVISTFILKIGDEQRLLFLGAATLYSGVLLAINGIKGFHFSSNSIEQRKEKIKDSLKIVISIEQLQKIDSESKPALKKLILVEKFQKIFLILTFSLLVLSFIIA